jgi:hypothetical protein
MQPIEAFARYNTDLRRDRERLTVDKDIKM